MSHLDGFQELLFILNTQFIVFTHRKAAGAALRMHKECLKQRGSSGYNGWVAERS